MAPPGMHLENTELAAGALCDQHFTCYECVADRILDEVGKVAVRSNGCCVAKTAAVSIIPPFTIGGVESRNASEL
jgi:hypothetical protein